MSEYENDIVAIQKKLYGMGPERRGTRLFNYDTTQLQPTYKLKVLNPFIESLGAKPVWVLELGAGKGEAALYMANMGLNVVSTDISDEGLKWKRLSVMATAWRLPFKDSSFEGVHSKDMITHIPYALRDKLFSELYRVTKPSGLVLICSAEIESESLYQYPTDETSLIKLGRRSNFRVEGRKIWVPERGLSDWYFYPKPIPRFVLELRKISP